EDSDTTGSLHDKLAALGGSMIVEALRRMERGELTSTPQPEEGVTYTAKISKDEAKLDFALTAVALWRKVRAFNPFPAAQGMVNGTAVKIWKAELADYAGKAAPGTVLSSDAQGIVVACGEGALRLLELEKPGGERLG
uniref:methionyl-tRNA formyltransferase n=1 Tax=Achromobacter sp. GbtcB20 TaxID=2824765 RepID=UPI00353020A3